MSTPKKQHYVPKMLLKRFATNDMLFVMNKEDMHKNRKFQSLIKQLHIDSVAIRYKFYTYKDKEGNEHLDVETNFKNIEGETKRIIDNLEKMLKPTNDDINTLAFFIALQMQRTPIFRKKTRDRFNKDQDKLLSQVIDKKVIELKGQENPPIALIGKLLEKKSQIVPGKQIYEMENMFLFARMFKTDLIKGETLTVKIVNEIKKMNWLFLYGNNTSGFLITDNPFIIIPPDDFNPLEEPGLQTPGVKITCPLSQYLCLQIIDYGNLIHPVYIDQASVDEINFKLTCFADKYIYTQNIDLLKKMIPKMKKKEKIHGKVGIYRIHRRIF